MIIKYDFFFVVLETRFFDFRYYPIRWLQINLHILQNNIYLRFLKDRILDWIDLGKKSIPRD